MIRASLKDELALTAQKFGFEGARDVMFSEAKECAYFINDPTRPRDELGKSRLGGMPDLPAWVQWPGASTLDRVDTLAPALFLAQFDMRNVPDIEGFNIPRQGMLWLFTQCWDRSDGPLMAIYDANPQDLSPRPIPSDSKYNIRPMPIRFERGISLPFYRKSFRSKLASKTNNLDYTELQHAVMKESNAKGQIGGYSVEDEYDLYRRIAFRVLDHVDYIEADRYESVAEFERKGKAVTLIASDSAKPNAMRKLAELRPKVEWIEQHRAEIEAEAASWHLLFRFGRNLEADLDIGDAMSLDIFIRSSDLHSMRFDNLIGEMPQVL